MMRNEIYSKEHTKLREILKRERIVAGLRQQDVADKTNRSQEYVSKFERGGLRLDVIDFLKFCEAIGCDPIVIMKELMHKGGSRRGSEKGQSYVFEATSSSKRRR